MEFVSATQKRQTGFTSLANQNVSECKLERESSVRKWEAENIYHE